MKSSCTCKIGTIKGRALQLIYCYIPHNYAILQVMSLICHSANSFIPLTSPVGVGCCSVYKKWQELRLTTQGHSKKITDCFIFFFLLLIFFWRLLKKKIQNSFSHPYFIIHILSSSFSHPHFVIRILLSAIRHPPSTIRRHPVIILQRPKRNSPVILGASKEIWSQTLPL